MIFKVFSITQMVFSATCLGSPHTKEDIVNL